MMKRFWYLFLAISLILLCVSSCSPEKERLLGRWETRIQDEELGSVDLVYHFTEDGQVRLEQKEGDTIPFSIPFGTFTLSGDRITIDSDGKTSSFTFSLSSEELVLVSEDQNEIRFHRLAEE